MVLALFSRMYLSFSTPVQMFIGCLVGLGEGFFLSIFFFFLRAHDYDLKIVRFLNRWYINISEDFIDHAKHMVGREDRRPNDLCVPQKDSYL